MTKAQEITKMSEKKSEYPLYQAHEMQEKINVQFQKLIKSFRNLQAEFRKEIDTLKNN